MAHVWSRRWFSVCQYQSVAFSTLDATADNISLSSTAKSPAVLWGQTQTPFARKSLRCRVATPSMHNQLEWPKRFAVSSSARIFTLDYPAPQSQRAVSPLYFQLGMSCHGYFWHIVLLQRTTGSPSLRWMDIPPALHRRHNLWVVAGSVVRKCGEHLDATCNGITGIWLCGRLLAAV